MPGIALIADDLTGAMDSGLQFGKRGLPTLVAMSPERLPDAEVLVVDTDTREARATEAYRRVGEVARALAGRRLYKKVDSTMRGNVGYECRALLEALRPRAIVVAPAFPQGGRTTRDGIQRVDGKPLELTPFAHDPRWPMRQSHLPTLLLQQAGREVGHVPLQEVERGPEALAAALEARPEPLIVADALEDAHLAAIAGAVVALGEGWLPCGSAGLAEQWAAALGLGEGRGEAPPADDAGPVLVVAGSRNDVTVAQLQRALAERGLPCVEVDPHQWWEPSGQVRRLAEECLAHLGRRHDVVLTASLAPLVAGRGGAVASLLGGVVAEVVGRAALGGLFITGGDIAVATCRALGVQALAIAHEVQAGVPGGRLVGGRADGLRVVTKAGGFGDERAILDALDYLHGALPPRR